MKRSIAKQAFAGLVFSSLFFCSCVTTNKSGNTYPIEPVPFTSVHLTDHFWAPKIKTNHEVTIPIAIEQSTLTGRIRNFEIAGGLTEGKTPRTVFIRYSRMDC